MRRLYHNILSPVCRKVRIALMEKGISCELISEDFVCVRADFLKMNPAGEVPVFIDANGTVVPDHSVICEFLEETYPSPSLLPKEPLARIEARRLTRFFDEKFSREVSVPLLMEKVVKSLKLGGTPNSNVIRKSKALLREHLKYIEWLAVRRNWLAGEDFSYADIAAAAHLSVIDYLGDIDWDKFADAKDWYSRIKSRPSFRGILRDRQTGFVPPSYYSELDF